MVGVKHTQRVHDDEGFEFVIKHILALEIRTRLMSKSTFREESKSLLKRTRADCEMDSARQANHSLPASRRVEVNIAVKDGKTNTHRGQIGCTTLECRKAR